MLQNWDTQLLEFINFPIPKKYQKQHVLTSLYKKIGNTKDKQIKDEFLKLCESKNVEKNYYLKSWHTGLINISSYKILTSCMMNHILDYFVDNNKKDIIILNIDDKGKKVTQIDI